MAESCQIMNSTKDMSDKVMLIEEKEWPELGNDNGEDDCG